MPEEARYRILREGEVRGQGILRIEEEGERLRLTQEFQGRGFQDRAVAVVAGQTLKPLEVRRVISGPEGERRWEVHYFSDVVEVRQRAGGDQRTDQINVPPHSYDKWSEIFVWRTIDFKVGYRATYTSVISADLGKPKRASITLQVVGKERVEVPAGSFEAWRLEIRQPGPDQLVWIADSQRREVVRYDNGFFLFELEEGR